MTKWLVCVIGQLYGNVNPHVIILAGQKQGTNKTEFWRTLLPESLADYYAETNFDDQKDEKGKMERYLILMNDEWAGKTAKDEKFLKYFLSQSKMTMRKSYGKHVESYRRTASICATSNIEAILGDPTGNRRIIPIKVIKDLQRDRLKAINRDFLFAEVMHLYHKHPECVYEFDPYLNPDDVDFLKDSTHAFCIDSLEEDMLEASGFRPWLSEEDGVSISLKASVVREIIQKNLKTLLDPTHFGIAMKKAGFSSNDKPRRVNGKLGRYYDLVLTKKLEEALNFMKYEF